jgi:hypothetical protein
MGFILYECTLLMMIFVQVFSQWGLLGLYFLVQSKTDPKHWYLVLALGESLMLLLMG